MPLLLAVAQSEAAGTATLSPIGFGLLTGGVLLALLAFTYAFRNAGNRHAGQHGDQHAGQHGHQH